MDKIRLITLFRAPVQSVRIFDTLSGEKEEFAAIANSNNSVVKMLLCGPTVYDYSHVGHARMLLFYDLMARYFRAKGRNVKARPSRLQAGHFASQEIARGHFAVGCKRKPGCRVF